MAGYGFASNPPYDLLGPAEFGAFIKKEHARSGAVVKESGVTIE